MSAEEDDIKVQLPEITFSREAIQRAALAAAQAGLSPGNFEFQRKLNAAVNKAVVEVATGDRMRAEAVRLAQEIWPKMLRDEIERVLRSKLRGMAHEIVDEEIGKADISQAARTMLGRMAGGT
jgi:hypothetical protein